MTRRRRVLLVVALLIISSLLAILLRSVVYEVVILPVAFLGFQLSIWYHSLSQGIWWWLIIALVLFMLAFSLVAGMSTAGRSIRLALRIRVSMSATGSVSIDDSRA